jgi:hypothetical protein
MAMIGIHQALEVGRQRDAEPEDKRNQNNEREEGTISRLGILWGSWGRVGQRLSIQKSGLADLPILIRREVLIAGLRENGDTLLRK